MPMTTEERYPYPRNHVEEIKRANSDGGFYFFEPDTLRFFRSRISDRVYGGRYFVTSEDDGSRGRRYTVRRSNPNGDIATIGPFFEMTRTEAHRLAKACADVGETEALAQEGFATWG